MNNPVNIVITDGYTTNPGDLSWSALEALGTVSAYDRSTRDELPARVAHADIIVTNKVIWDAESLSWAPQARMIALLSTGYNTIDLAECTKRGITVANVPAYSTPDVAQMTFGLLLELTLHVGLHSQGVLEGRWVASSDFCYWDAPLTELAGKTFGIVGMGSIGTRVAHIARAFGMNVIFANRSAKPQAESENVRQVELNELLARADVVSLHVPATPDTVGFMDAAALAQMKDGAILLNTARGNVVNEADVAAALESGKLAGFGADVVSVEPMRADNPLLIAAQAAQARGEQLNLVITPHISWAVQQARERLIAEVVKNIAAFLNGETRNVVS